MNYSAHITTSSPSMRQKIMLREKPWLTDDERKRLRLTGRSIYGEYPYVKTDKEKEEWESTRKELEETH